MPARIGNEFQVNTFTISSQQLSSVATLSSGNFVVAWTSAVQDSGSFGVYGQLFTDIGVAIGSEFQINTFTFGVQQLPSVAALTTGDFIVSWQSGHDGSGNGVYGQLFNSSGIKIGSEFQVHTFTLNNQINPSVTGLSTGGFVVTWESNSNSLGESGFGIRGQLFSNNGVPIGSEFRVNTFISNNQGFPSVAALNTGSFVVTWDSDGQDPPGIGVYGQVFSDTGTKIGSEFRVNTFTANDQKSSSVTGLSTGGFAVAWASTGQDGSATGVYGQLFSNTGTKVGSEFQINTFTNSDQTNPSVVALSTGEFAVTWQSGTDFGTNQDGSLRGVYGQLFSNTGTKIGSEFQINTYTTNNQLNPSVAALGPGKFVVTWDSGSGSSTLGDQDGSLFGVFGQRFTSATPTFTATNTDQSFTYIEDTPFNLADMVITYSPNENVVTTVTLTLSNPLAGTLSTGTSGTVSSSYNAPTGEWRAFGPVEDINALLAAVVFNPTPNRSENLSINVRIDDGFNSVLNNTIAVTGTPINDVPVANNDAFSSSEDNAISNNVLSNDTDVESSSLTAVLVSGPTNGSLTLNPNGSFTYTPNANFNGVDSFTYRTNDGTDNSNIATVTLTVTPVNDVPVANNDAFSGDEDTVISNNVLINDIDVDNDPLVAGLISRTKNGELSLNIDGSFTYTPNANFNGVDSFTYRAGDGLLTTNSNIANVTLTVNAVNDAPIANNDVFSGNEDTVISSDVFSNVLSNDTDVENDPLTASLVAGPANGNVTLNPDGSFTYIPNLNFNGVDSFSYRANDGIANSNIATMTIHVNGVNDAPIANNDAFSSNEDTVIFNNVLSNDTDVENNPLTAVLVSGPTNGGLALNPNGSFTYTPNANFNGVDSFTYRANDGIANSNIATVTLTVNAVDDVPVANNDAFSGNEDTAISNNVLSNDIDVDNNPLTAVLISGPTNGSLTLNPNGSFTYTPNANFNGVDSFTYRANDGITNSNTATVTLTVNAVNDAPVANNDAFSGNEDTAISNSVLSNDSDVENNPLTASLVTGPTNGNVTLNPDGSFTYTPNLNFNGVDSFTYRANDGIANSNTATVTLTVNAINDKPTLSSAAPANPSIREDALPFVLDTTLVLADVDNTNLASATIQLQNPISGDSLACLAPPDIQVSAYDAQTGTLTLSNIAPISSYQAALRSVTYTTSNLPIQGSIAKQVALTVSDGTDASAALLRNFNMVEFATPVLVQNSLAITEGQTKVLTTSDLSATDPDTPANQIRFTVTSLSNGRFERVLNSGVAVTQFTQQDIVNNQIQFVHDGSEIAPFFQITLTDGRFTVGPHPANIQFTPVNDAPLVVNPIDGQTANIGESFNFVFEDNVFSDPENQPLTYTAKQGNGNALPGWLSFNPAQRLFSGTPTEESITSIDIAATDPGNLTTTTQFNLLTSNPANVLTSVPGPGLADVHPGIWAGIAAGGALLLGGISAFTAWAVRRWTRSSPTVENIDAELDPAKPRGIAPTVIQHPTVGEGKQAYYLLDQIYRKEADELKKQAGMKLIIPEGQFSVAFIFGQGNYGQTALARRVHDGEYVVVKQVTHPDRAKAEKKIAESEQEDSIHAKLVKKKVPHILPFYGSTKVVEDVPSPILYQFMGLAGLGNGTDVQKIMQYKLLKQEIEESDREQVLIHTATCLLECLAGMHQEGIYHLDMKPGNMVFTHEGGVYVIDFGCAYQTKQKNPQLTQFLKGDFAYFPPQRLQNAVAKDTEMSQYPYSLAKADSWAVGLSLLELATGVKWGDRLVEATQQSDFRGVIADFTLHPDKIEDTIEAVLAKIEPLAKAKKGTLWHLIKGLLDTDERRRPTCQEALKHSVFGAQMEAMAPEDRIRLFGDLQKVQNLWRNGQDKETLDSLLSSPSTTTLTSESSTHNIPLSVHYSMDDTPSSTVPSPIVKKPTLFFQQKATAYYGASPETLEASGETGKVDISKPEEAKTKQVVIICDEQETTSPSTKSLDKPTKSAETAHLSFFKPENPNNHITVKGEEPLYHPSPESLTASRESSYS